MSKALDSRLTRALATVEPSAPNLQEAGGVEFGQQREGRTTEDLKWVVGPCTDNPRRVQLDANGERVDAGPAERWTIDEVWAAISPMVRRIARTYTTGGWAKNRVSDPTAFDDAVQNAAVRVVSVITRGDDQSRIGNQFTSWLEKQVKSAIRGGVKPGAEFNAARGLLGLLRKAKTTQEVDAQISRIQERDRQQHEHLYRRDNEFGKYAPLLYNLAMQLRTAIAHGDEESIRHSKREIKDQWDELGDAEGQETFAGAATGLHDLWWRPHSGEYHDKEMKRKREGVTKPGAGGEDIDNPHLPHHEEDTEGAANREVIRHVLEIARRGYQGPEGELEPVSTQAYRILIRYYGVADYPDRGTDRDPELIPERYEQAVAALRATGHFDVRPVNVTEAARLAELAGASQEETREIISVTMARDQGEFGDKPLESDVADIEVQVDKNDEAAITEIAGIVGYSHWVRSGCPAMQPSEIAAYWNISAPRVSQIINSIGRPEGPGKGKKAQPGFLRQVGRMLSRRLRGEEAEDEPGQPVGEARTSNGSFRNSSDVVSEAIMAGWTASEILRRRVSLTEAVDDIGCRLVLQTCNYVSRRTAAYFNEVSRSH